MEGTSGGNEKVFRYTYCSGIVGGREMIVRINSYKLTQDQQQILVKAMTYYRTLCEGDINVKCRKEAEELLRLLQE